MPVPVALGWLLAVSPVVVPLVRRALFAVGFGLVTYVGVSATFDALEAQVYSNLGNTSASILALLGMAKVDVAIRTGLAAAGIKLGFMGLNAAGNIVRPRWKFVD